jgi:hypothetical protein
LPLTGGAETIFRAALWQIYQNLYILFRAQKDRFTTAQDAGIIVLSMGGWDTHSSTLGLQTQHNLEWIFNKPKVLHVVS